MEKLHFRLALCDDEGKMVVSEPLKARWGEIEPDLTPNTLTKMIAATDSYLSIGLSQDILRAVGELRTHLAVVIAKETHDG